ncbi:MAG: fatty acid desaturase [Phycisphaeraceae bacterium]|nr:fatty acid desaturase [Phycisphaeraceae bacterium]
MSTAHVPTSPSTLHIALKQNLSISRLDWTAVLGIGLLHVACIAAPFTFTWSGLAWFIGLWWVSGGLGVCLCYHRLLTHRSFRTPKWFEYFLAFCGALSLQGPVAKWVGTHRLHHCHSDEEMDPHSPVDSFLWGHVWWMFWRYPEGSDPTQAAGDLLKDPFYRFMNTFYWIPQLIVAAALFFGGWAVGGLELGLSWVVWGIAVRTIVVYHVTWLVNSASHKWGYRNFETKDHSTNLWWVALLSWGEGWHNNHHAEQRSARHGRKWFEFDLTYLTIRALSWVGLARDIVEPKKAFDR